MGNTPAPTVVPVTGQASSLPSTDMYASRDALPDALSRQGIMQQSSGGNSTITGRGGHFPVANLSPNVRQSGDHAVVPSGAIASGLTRATGAS